MGDVHNRFDEMELYPEHTILQVGDLCIRPEVDYPTWSDNFHFISGNHDKRALCKDHPNYLGDYGYKPEWDMFYISGAKSYDIPGHDIEELSRKEKRAAIEMCADIKPRILLTHEGPYSPVAQFFGYGACISSMKTFMQDLFDIYQPELWVFGHHHASRRMTIGKTEFVCLDKLELYEP